MKQEGYNTHLAIKASPEKVFEVLTVPEKLRLWWENPVGGSANEGGQLTFGFEDSDDYSVMQVEEAKSPSVVRWKVLEDTGFDGEWVGTAVLFEIKKTGNDSCELHFTHVGLTPNLRSYKGCVRGWNHYLSNIAAVATST